jgi:SAM-dependent MidA family methyltransferase
VLPQADAAALAHSARATEHIRQTITQAGGWISFERYMELALYAPGVGYYSAGVVSIGQKGDFVTSPEISPLFAHALARQAAQIIATTGGQILELGAGNGTLAAELLQQLERDQALPSRYYILELSSALRERQMLTLSERAPQLASRVEWLRQLPDQFTGFIFGNEVLDALPVRTLTWRDDGLMERGVTVVDDQLVWQERAVNEPELQRAAQKIEVAPLYASELSIAAPALTRTLAGLLQSGVILFIDYGFGQSEFYHPQRSTGTLMCHYRQYAHDDPFFLPGVQDITAHVNFSAIAECASECGARLLGYTSQAQFLINCGITDLLAQTPAHQSSRYLPLASGVQILTSPAEMGELFKVIAVGNLSDSLLGFRTGDRRRQL